MKMCPCQYAIIQFMPFAETGEFANVGVILLCPQQRFFEIKLQDKRWGRVTRFFGELKASTYREALRYTKVELKRFRSLLKSEALDGRRATINEILAFRLFNEVVRPRETVVRFGTPRAILAKDPKVTLENLFGFYVNRDFATKEYLEATMAYRMRKLLTEFNLSNQYTEDVIGNSGFHVKFPFVHKGEAGTRVIKPLYLAQDEATKVLEHGGAWVNKIDRLKRRNLLPDAVLFTVDGGASAEQAGAQREAFLEICGDLRNQGMEVVEHTQIDSIVEFASRGVDVLRLN